jgi:hypothetical protein
MYIRTLSLRVLICAFPPCSGQASAQPVIVPIPPPVIIVTPPPGTPTTGGQVSWDDAARHFKVSAVYDGQQVKIVSVTAGEGPARSYLTDRPDIVVLVLDEANAPLRQFNVPNPLEYRVWEAPSETPRLRRPPPDIGVPIRPPGVRGPERDASRESNGRRETVTFDVFIPRLDGARWIEFRSGGPKGQLLGRADLSSAR